MIDCAPPGPPDPMASPTFPDDPALLTVEILQAAKVEDVERLARSLKVVPVPLRDPYAYQRVLCGDVIRAIREQET